MKGAGKIALIVVLVLVPLPMFWLFAHKGLDAVTFFGLSLVSWGLVLANIWDMGHQKRKGALLLVSKARDLMEKGQLHAASEALAQAGKLDKNCFEARVARGELYSVERDYAKARRALLEALEIKPDSYRAHFALGLTYLNEQKIYEAVSEFRQTINLKNDFSEAHFILAQAYELTGEKDKACESYRKFLQIAQGDLAPGPKITKYVERAQERLKALK
ncbi:MAG: tetratricopeptide repeat protein [Candidatus Eremiobacterota bacterium]